MLRLPLIVLMLTPGIAHAQKFISTAEALQPVVVQNVQTMALDNSAATDNAAANANVVDPVGPTTTDGVVALTAGGSLYLSEEYFSEGSVENGTNADVSDHVAIEAADIVWVEDGNFEAATLALGECNAGTVWSAEDTDCNPIIGN